MYDYKGAFPCVLVKTEGQVSALSRVLVKNEPQVIAFSRVLVKYDPQVTAFSRVLAEIDPQVSTFSRVLAQVAIKMTPARQNNAPILYKQGQNRIIKMLNFPSFPNEGKDGLAFSTQKEVATLINFVVRNN